MALVAGLLFFNPFCRYEQHGLGAIMTCYVASALLPRSETLIGDHMDVEDSSMDSGDQEMVEESELLKELVRKESAADPKTGSLQDLLFMTVLKFISSTDPKLQETAFEALKQVSFDFFVKLSLIFH